MPSIILLHSVLTIGIVMLLSVALGLVVLRTEASDEIPRRLSSVAVNLIRPSPLGKNSPPPPLTMMPIKVLVCTEALCPDCKLFVQEQLAKTYELLGERVMDLKYVPFGNARINETTKQVICQHGPAECDANLYQQCAIGVYPETRRHLPFMSCLDSILPMGYHDEPFDTAVFETCANTTGLSFHRIKACHDIPQVAWSLITRAAKDTPSYHTYVPWVELDGAPIDVDDGELLITKICAAFEKAGGWDPLCDAL